MESRANIMIKGTQLPTKDQSTFLNIMVTILNQTESTITVEIPCLVGFSIKGEENTFNFSARIDYIPEETIELDSSGKLDFEVNMTEYLSEDDVLRPGNYEILLRCMINMEVYVSEPILLNVL